MLLSIEIIGRIIKWITELDNSDRIAFVALCSSLLSGFYTWISNIRNIKKEELRLKEQDRVEREVREQEKNYRAFQKEFSKHQQRINELQFDLERQSELKPFFHINHHSSRIFMSNDDIIIELYLTNVGRASATNIQLVQLKSINDYPVYFDSGYNILTHTVHDYFSDYFAIQYNSVSISIKEKKIEAGLFDAHINKLVGESHSYKLNFKLSFSDVMENQYEQEFYIIYDYNSDNSLDQSISKNSMSYPPKLMKDI